MITHESVEFVRQFPKVSIVKNSIGELKLIPSRYTEGKRIGNDMEIPTDVLARGIEYGIDWNLVFPEGLTIGPEELKKCFYSQGIFTIEDLQKDPNIVLAAINSILKLTAVEIIKKAKDTLGGE